MKITINNQEVEVSGNETIIETARRMGFEIPSLCYAKDAEHKSSCMVCVVKNCDSGQIIPSCTTKPTEGMRIDTESEEVLSIRAISLELLISDHRADCEAPCSMACPGGLDVAAMNRLYDKGSYDEALFLLRDSLVIPATLCYICNAPCEKICRRGSIDNSVAIREIKKELVLKHGKPSLENSFKVETIELNKETNISSSHGRIAVLGSSPAGLSAAYYLCSVGYEVTVFEKSSQILTPHIEAALVPEDIIELEIEVIKQKGIKFVTHDNENIFDITINTNDFVAVINTTDSESKSDWFTLMTKIKQPARLVLEGRKLAKKVHKSLSDSFTVDKSDLSEEESDTVTKIYDSDTEISEVSARISDNASEKSEIAVTSGKKQFNSSFGKFTDCEKESIKKQTTDSNRRSNCLYCDCDKKTYCRLRTHATEYSIKKNIYNDSTTSKALQRQYIKSNMWFEQAKCIKCGLCVYNSNNGFTFRQRGFGMEVFLPEESAKNATENLTELCPTGALYLRNGSRLVNH